MQYNCCINSRKNIMPFIENISLIDVKNGWHYDASPNSVLIQIVDNDMTFPTPKYNFKEVHQFKFLDEEHPERIINKEFTACTYAEAQQIVEILLRALANQSNVIVHCHAGICRSGAVAQFGVDIGFQDTEKYRQPNLLVKSLLNQAYFDMMGI